MGEYIYASFRAGGRISRNQAQKLVEIGTAYGLSVDGGGGELTIEDVGKEWSDDQINYGNLDDLTDFCARQKLDYEHHYESGGEWDATTIKVIDGVAVEFAVGQEGAVVPISELVKLDALASGWAKFHEKIRVWAREVPDVVLYGELDEDWDEEEENAEEENL